LDFISYVGDKSREIQFPSTRTNAKIQVLAVYKRVIVFLFSHDVSKLFSILYVFYDAFQLRRPQ